MKNKECDYGCKQEAKFQLKNGKWCCSKSPNSCKSKRENDSTLKKDKVWKNGHPRKNKPAWNKGLTKKTDNRLQIKSDKLKKKYKNGELTPSFKNKSHSKETREKLSKLIKERYQTGWMPKAGRCKKINYYSSIAGEVLLDGNWELKVAQYLDQNNINWRRNVKKFNYTYENKERTYTPDFYLIDTDEYIEVKGYETEKDKSKWSQFPGRLLVWKKKELIEKNII